MSTHGVGSERRRQRTPLTRRAVLSAGVHLADREGIDAVSMRRLADTLGVVPMALYKHVTDKEDLLDGMVDAVIGEFPADEPDSGGEAAWKPAIRHTVLAARRIVASHPWARGALETRTRRSPAVLGYMEALTSCFLRGGVSPDLTHHAMHALGNRIWGFSPELFNDPGRPGDRTRPAERSPDPADYPGIVAVAADAAARRPGAVSCDEDFEFGFALDLILDAVERLHTAGWSSPTSAPSGAAASGLQGAGDVRLG